MRSESRRRDNEQQPISKSQTELDAARAKTRAVVIGYHLVYAAARFPEPELLGHLSELVGGDPVTPEDLTNSLESIKLSVQEARSKQFRLESEIQVTDQRSISQMLHDYYAEHPEHSDLASDDSAA
jgi:hypothetical protein